MTGTAVPTRLHTLPSLNHRKDEPYIDYPLIYNDTVTEEPFYVDKDFTFVTSDTANTTLYKWNGGDWTELADIDNPTVIYGRGYYAVTTAADAYVAITEHDDT